VWRVECKALKCHPVTLNGGVDEVSVVWLNRYRRRLRFEPAFDVNDPDFSLTPSDVCFYCGEPLKDADLAIYWMGIPDEIWLHPECTFKLVARLYADAVTAIVHAKEQTFIKEVERILSTEPFQQIWCTLKPKLEAILEGKVTPDTSPKPKQGKP
jgi:hypothetical protein